MNEARVTIATFHIEPEFLVTRTRLESAGIECFVLGENLFRIAGWNSPMLGGIELQVRESDVQDAVAILHDTAPPQTS